MCVSSYTHVHTQREKGESPSDLELDMKPTIQEQFCLRDDSVPTRQSNKVMKSWEMLVLLYYSVLKRACELVL